jgi:hypothetical protein
MCSTASTPTLHIYQPSTPPPQKHTYAGGHLCTTRWDNPPPPPSHTTTECSNLTCSAAAADVEVREADSRVPPAPAAGSVVCSLSGSSSKRHTGHVLCCSSNTSNSKDRARSMYVSPTVATFDGVITSTWCCMQVQHNRPHPLLWQQHTAPPR